MRRSWLALLGLLCAAPLLGAALRHHVRQEKAWSLVRAAASAHERVSYTGRAAWRDTRWGRSVKVVHDAERGYTRYDWESRGFRKGRGPGRGRRPGSDRSRRRGGFGFVTSGPNSRTPDPAAWCLDLNALEASYRAAEGSSATYLGRRTRLVILTPRHAGRPTVHLTLDAATALPLKVASHGADEKLYRVAAFRELEIGPQEVERPARRHFSQWFGARVPADDVTESAGFRVLEPAYLPPGFRCIDRRVRGTTLRKVTYVYTDGVTAFELRQEIVPTPAQLETAFSRRFGRQAASRMMQGFLQWRMNALASGKSGKGAACRRWHHGKHRSYALRVGDVEVKLTARGDLGSEETLRVLRSLRAR